MTLPDNTINRMPSEGISRNTSGDRDRPDQVQPNQRKNFRKILDDDGRKAPEERTVPLENKKRSSVPTTAKNPKSQLRSPFEPSRPVAKNEDTGDSTEEKDEDEEEISIFSPPKPKLTNAEKKPQAPMTDSPFNLYKKMAKETVSAEQTSQASGEIAPPLKNFEGFRKEKTTSRYHQEQPDLSYVNPFGGPPPSIASVGEEPLNIKGTVISQMKEIVEQIVDKLYVIESQGKSEVYISLKYPPLFEGAQVVVTSFTTANKEFNLAFENLRPDAKLLLDNNMHLLRQSLTENGYAKALHIVTTTTIIEHNIAMGPSEPERGEKERQGEQHQQQQEEEET